VPCRGDWVVKSVIPTVQRRGDGKFGGKWRSQTALDYLQKLEIGRRWALESFFSALKRTMGSALSARKPDQMLAEAAFKSFAYTPGR